MKNLKLTTLGLALVAAMTLLPSCFGKFVLTRKIYTWNDSLGNKFIKQIAFWGLNIIPVYGIASGIDALVLNLIEFWTGSNPLAMQEGQKEQQTILLDGITYQITATKDKFEIVQLSGENKGNVTSLEYNTSDLSWYSVKEMNRTKVLQYENTMWSSNIIKTSVSN